MEFCCFSKLKPLYQETLAIFTWELWKIRNIVMNGGTISFNRVAYEINNTLNYFAKVRYLWPPNIPYDSILRRV